MSSKVINIKELRVAKIIFMLGVVLIHCNLKDLLPEAIKIKSSAGLFIEDYISYSLCNCCVPAFFIISGFLFFRNIPIDSSVSNLFISYKKKIYSRARTLLLPYFIWNIIGAFFLILKGYYNNYDSFGVIIDGQIQWREFFKGFLYLQNGYPYDFPLWFIRNLILYVVISPIFYYLSKKTIIFIISQCLIFLVWGSNPHIKYFMVIYFLIGSYLGLHEKYYSFIKNRFVGIGSIFLWIVFSALNLLLTDIPLISLRLISFISNIAGCCAIIWISDKFLINKLKLSAQAVFFIYACHGLYFTVARKIMLYIFGYRTSLQILLAYFGSFILMVSLSLLLYIIIKTISPKLSLIMSGGR